jgi:hypothetical protein
MFDRPQNTYCCVLVAFFLRHIQTKKRDLPGGGRGFNFQNGTLPIYNFDIAGFDCLYQGQMFIKFRSMHQI